MASYLESLPGFCVGQMVYEEYMGEHFNTKDPYYDTEGHRRKLPPNATESQKKLWKKIRNMAYKHDRCMFGMNCCDLGVGLAPIASIIPVIGPLAMYVVHGRLLTIAEELRIPQSMHAKMSAQILFDFLITLIPLLGIFFSYLNQCSTRNAGMIYTYLCHELTSVDPNGFQRVQEGYIDSWDNPYGNTVPNDNAMLMNHDAGAQSYQPHQQSFIPMNDYPGAGNGKKNKKFKNNVSPQETGFIQLQ